MRVFRLPAIRVIFSVIDLCSEEQSGQCNNQAIRNYLQEWKLQFAAVLIFREFLSDQGYTIDLGGLREESVGLRGFESVFVDFQTLDFRFEGLRWQP